MRRVFATGFDQYAVAGLRCVNAVDYVLKLSTIAPSQSHSARAQNDGDAKPRPPTAGTACQPAWRDQAKCAGAGEGVVTVMVNASSVCCCRR